eukprot:CAMPEP_0198564402 /NCGR_PEP_ID=MMETSP1462-20131121/100247_1 /TAXON_ID=1333877 /ORGANISM="Brandtodinium nutriculum, Strain RCC3387" /LENGTH=187 /DNA_ID=CAMNT_0044295375 /DNA_START=240 /DNA_END=804 /DNA_ORIENTATION=-
MSTQQFITNKESNFASNIATWMGATIATNAKAIMVITSQTSRKPLCSGLMTQPWPHAKSCAEDVSAACVRKPCSPGTMLDLICCDRILAQAKTLGAIKEAIFVNEVLFVVGEWRPVSLDETASRADSPYSSQPALAETPRPRPVREDTPYSSHPARANPRPRIPARTADPHAASGIRPDSPLSATLA